MGRAARSTPACLRPEVDTRAGRPPWRTRASRSTTRSTGPADRARSTSATRRATCWRSPTATSGRASDLSIAFVLLGALVSVDGPALVGVGVAAVCPVGALALAVVARRLRLEGADRRRPGQVELLPVRDHRVVLALVVLPHLLAPLHVVGEGPDVRADHRGVDRLTHDARGPEHHPADRVLPAHRPGARVERVEVL